MNQSVFDRITEGSRESKPLATLIILPSLLALVIAIGCKGKQNDKVRKPVGPDFGEAMETVATSTDWDSRNAAIAELYHGGLPAIDALREYLDDDRVIDTIYSTRAINSSMLRVRDEAFFILQDIIEINLPEAYEYATLTPSNVENWLDRHEGNSLIELQIEATSNSLSRAKQEFERTSDVRLGVVISVYSEHLMDLRENGGSHRTAL